MPYQPTDQDSAVQSFGSEEAKAAPELRPVLLTVMALACGVFVANVYYNQPIFELLLRAYPDAPSTVGLIPMATQLGFACGLFLLIPLGDRMDRRRLILWQAAALCMALIFLATAPYAWVAVIASVAVGITGSVAQQIVPFAAGLAAPDRRGQVVGTVMSGVLCGILLGRAVGGFAGGHWGWRATFGFGATLSALVWVALWVWLPSSRPETRDTYAALMKSLAALWRDEPRLRRATCIQAALFGSFIGLWTILSLHMHEAFGLGAQAAGLMGMVGAAGILIAPLAGRIADRRGPYVVIGLGCLIMALSYVVMGVWGSLIGLVVGIVVLDLGEQAALISNQHVVYALRQDARSRLNTIFMSGMFLGGAAGSWAASLAWRTGGWPTVCTLGGMFALLGFAIHFYGRLGQAR